MLYSTPIRRGVALVIEDFVSLSNIKVCFNFPKEIKTVSLVPENQNLDIMKVDKEQSVIIPEFKNHCAIVFHYV